MMHNFIANVWKGGYLLKLFDQSTLIKKIDLIDKF